MANIFDQFDAGGNPFDRFDPIAPRSSVAQELTGIPKQIGAGMLEGGAAIPGAVPRGLQSIGSVISNETGLPEPPPIINAPPTPDAQLSAALPAPQSGIEEAARTFGQFPLSGLTAKGHLGENIVGGIGAGLGAYFGPQAAPYLGATPEEGSIGGALAGGFAGARTAGNAGNFISRNKMPSPQEVLNAADDAYTALRRSNKEIILPRDQMAMVKNGTLNLLRGFGPDEADAKEVYSIVKNLDSDSGGTVADLINARKNLKSHFAGGPDANKPAAAMALQVMDAVIDKVGSPGTLAELKKSDANWSAARTAQAVDTKLTQAESRAEGANSGLNLGNNIIQNINAFIKSRTDSIGKVHLAPSDLEALNSARQLDKTQELRRWFSGVAGGGGGLGALAAGAAGAGSAAGMNELGMGITEKDPLYSGIALPMLGLLARRSFNTSVARAAKNASAAILSRAPYVQSLGATVPHPLLSAPQVAGRSLLFAAPAIRDDIASGAQ